MIAKHRFTSFNSLLIRVKIPGDAVFSLDFSANLADTVFVGSNAPLIYSPSDMPAGLRRGYSFTAQWQGVGHAD